MRKEVYVFFFLVRDAKRTKESCTRFIFLAQLQAVLSSRVSDGAGTFFFPARETKTIVQSFLYLNRCVFIHGHVHVFYTFVNELADGPVKFAATAIDIYIHTQSSITRR